MGNKVVAAACRFLAEKNVVSLEDFRERFANLPRVAPPECVVGEIENIVKRELARRAEAEKVHHLDDGTEIAVRRKDRTKPTLLTQFMIMDHGPSFPPLYFFLRPTKGWRWERTNAYEAGAYREQGVPTYDEIPNRKKEIRKRKVA